jgi:hypothetical protein
MTLILKSKFSGDDELVKKIDAKVDHVELIKR